MSTRDFSWGKGGRCVWLTTYHPCSAESREDPVLNLPGTPSATSACRGIPLLYFTLHGYHRGLGYHSGYEYQEHFLGVKVAGA
jgi:hypothetical protein